MSQSRPLGRTVVLVLLWTGAAAASPARAQSLHAAARTPLFPCCQVPRSTVAAALDTTPGLLRVAGIGAALDDVADVWRRYAIRSHHVGGAWRTTHTAAGVQRVHAEGEGVRRVGRWKLAGGASLHREREDGVAWRNQSEASLPALYVWADSVGGTFRGNDVLLHATIATPRWRAFSFGVPVELAIGQRARRNDPRPLSRRRVMEAAPSLRAQWGRHQIGLSVPLGAQREELEIGGGLSPEVPLVYRLRGIATFDRTQLISADRTLFGRTYGMRAGWAHRADNSQLALGGGIRIESDSVRDGIATPVSGGSTRRVRWEVRALWRHATVSGGQEWQVEASAEEARGTDPIFRAVNAIREGERTTARVVWWRGASPLAARWRADVELARASVLARDVAAEAQWQVTRLPIVATVQHRRPLGRRQSVFTTLGGGYTPVTNDRMRLSQTTRISPLFVTHDFAVHAAATTMAAWHLGIERAGGELGSSSLMRLSLGWEGARAHVALTEARPMWGRHAFTLQLELL